MNKLKVINMPTFNVSQECNECEDGKVYRDIVTTVSHICFFCDGSTTVEREVNYYDTEEEVREDYPDALQVTKLNSVRPLS
tara:strand:+ start:669 stop:911 length:243 start_codon:yes stop_codon:yes gene_type:complete